ncbi:MAG: hypothetical protein VKK62_11310, partial [Synechococcaceae cyanobacterium]|nr:hypothetical protein [Synechococcaceae cyanobacterium]
MFVALRHWGGACCRPLREDSGSELGKNLANAMLLDPVTRSLRARGIKGSLDAVSDRLFWRCTATGVDGVRKSRRITLGLPANPGMLIEAESRVVALAAEIARTRVGEDHPPAGGGD